MECGWYPILRQKNGFALTHHKRCYAYDQVPNKVKAQRTTIQCLIPSYTHKREKGTPDTTSARLGRYPHENSIKWLDSQSSHAYNNVYSIKTVGQGLCFLATYTYTHQLAGHNQTFPLSDRQGRQG